MSYSYNRFKSTTVFGAFRNEDVPDASSQATASFQRDVQIGGSLTDLSGNSLFTPYLSIAIAASTYLTITNAASTYLSNITAASTYLSITNATSTYLTQTNAASTYLTQSSATSTYAPLASPALTGTPSTTTPANGSNNGTRISTTAWCQSYFGNLSSGNVWLSGNYMSNGLAVGFSSGSLVSGTVLDVSGNTHISGIVDAGALQVNGSDISDLYAAIEPTQLR
jgi:hypothetical protein